MTLQPLLHVKARQQQDTYTNICDLLCFPGKAWSQYNKLCCWFMWLQEPRQEHVGCSKVGTELKFASSSAPHKFWRNQDLADKTHCMVYIQEKLIRPHSPKQKKDSLFQKYLNLWPVFQSRDLATQLDNSGTKSGLEITRNYHTELHRITRNLAWNCRNYVHMNQYKSNKITRILLGIIGIMNNQVINPAITCIYIQFQITYVKGNVKWMTLLKDTYRFTIKPCYLHTYIEQMINHRKAFTQNIRGLGIFIQIQ